MLYYYHFGPRPFLNTAMLTSIKTYLIEAVAEMRKVVWPTKKQTMSYTTLVIGLTLGMAVFMVVLDYFFNIGLKLLIQ